MATSKREKTTRSAKSIAEKPAQTLSDVTCPICFGILIKPVTTPCNHELCLDCFNRSIELAQLACPICRQRISIWTRQAVREHTLIDEKRWQQIQRNFSELVQQRLNGGTETDIHQWEDDASTVKNSISKPGEVKQEYEEFLKKYQEELRREREREEEASEQLIRELQTQDQQQMVEEKRTRQNVSKHDQVLAKDIYRQYIKSLRSSREASCSKDVSLELSDHEHNTASSKMKGSLTTDILASLDKENAQLRSTSTESHDSISSEMCHFKPISAAPRTPPKRLPDGRFQEPQVVHTKPRRLDYSNEYQSSKVLSIKIQAIMVDSQNKSECCLVPMHSSGTPFINKKFNGARKPNIDLSLKENYPFYSGSGSQSLSPTKSVLSGANQNGGATTRTVRSSRANKVTHKTEHNEENSVQRKRKSDDKAVQHKIARVEDNDETNSSTPDSQTFSTNEDIVWAELEREELDRLRQEEMDRQLAMQLQEEFNRSLQRGQQGPSNQYFLRSQKKK